MKRFSQESINYQIHQLTIQINALKGKAEECETINKVHNQLLVRRAVLKKALNRKRTNVFVEKIKSSVRKIKGERLICDYFK